MLAQMQMLSTLEQQPQHCDVLVFASDGSVATILQEYLVKQGMRVSVAGNPSVALDIATKQRPAVILMDCAYIGMGAAESFIGKLRESDVASQVIVMVGSGRELMAAQNLGACWLLRKPFLPDDLMGMIDQVLSVDCAAAGKR